MAVFDVMHTYAYYAGLRPGTIFSPVQRIISLRPALERRVELDLTSRAPELILRDDAWRKLARMPSLLLSNFVELPVEMRAAVILPASYTNSAARRYPTVYIIHGFGSRFSDVWSSPYLAQAHADMAAGKRPEMIYVFLDATCVLGHHVFADSDNNGPWSRALVEEFIPYLEKNFRMEATPRGRLLNGHSSGGWSSLWLQVTHPDFFGGVWSTSPDPVDFRNWMGTDLHQAQPGNLYRHADGSPRWLIRMGTNEVITVRDYAHWEGVLGDFGGQLASFDAVFGPLGKDGNPVKLFDRETGAIDSEVRNAWLRYDISALLQRDWATLGPKLKGKIHITVGSLDNIHLEEPVALLRDRLKNLGSDAVINIVPGRDHFNLVDAGMEVQIAREMYRAAHPEDAAVGK
jgi:S-formylglutathione hydrolase FrmB